MFIIGISLVAQWLKLHTFITKGVSSIPGQRTKIWSPPKYPYYKTFNQALSASEYVKYLQSLDD